SLLWLKHGRSGARSGYAVEDNYGTASLAPTNADMSYNSTGGTITSRRTNVGMYQFVFSGLARPVGATETVLASSFGQASAFCTIASWGNLGPSDLGVNVTCWSPSG